MVRVSVIYMRLEKKVQREEKKISLCQNETIKNQLSATLPIH